MEWTRLFPHISLIVPRFFLAARYYCLPVGPCFIKESEKIKLRHCNTQEMLADFLSKPLQGRLFRKFRQVFLRQDHISALQEFIPSSTEEPVEIDPDRDLTITVTHQ